MVTMIAASATALPPLRGPSPVAPDALAKALAASSSLGALPPSKRLVVAYAKNYEAAASEPPASLRSDS